MPVAARLHARAHAVCAGGGHSPCRVVQRVPSLTSKEDFHVQIFLYPFVSRRKLRGTTRGNGRRVSSRGLPRGIRTSGPRARRRTSGAPTVRSHRVTRLRPPASGSRKREFHRGAPVISKGPSASAVHRPAESMPRPASAAARVRPARSAPSTRRTSAGAARRAKRSGKTSAAAAARRASSVTCKGRTARARSRRCADSARRPPAHAAASVPRERPAM